MAAKQKLFDSSPAIGAKILTDNLQLLFISCRTVDVQHFPVCPVRPLPWCRAVWAELPLWLAGWAVWQLWMHPGALPLVSSELPPVWWNKVCILGNVTVVSGSLFLQLVCFNKNWEGLMLKDKGRASCWGHGSGALLCHFSDPYPIKLHAWNCYLSPTVGAIKYYLPTAVTWVKKGCVGFSQQGCCCCHLCWDLFLTLEICLARMTGTDWFWGGLFSFALDGIPRRWILAL